jgi:phenylalanyl-tRNA synthetase beta chain
MNFSYNWLQSFFKKGLPKPKKLAELLTLHSFEVTDVKKIDNDWLLSIDILPNRAPDCFSHLGIAREISAITNLKTQLNQHRVLIKEDKGLKAKDFISIEVKDKMACQRYTARIISGVEVGPSPKWIQERLRVCGLRPINNIVDIANYVMLETGQPLHAFDFEKISGPKSKIIKKIIVRRGKKGEKIVTLDNEKYELNEDILVIADEKTPLAIAGIKGGKKAEIDKKTKVVVLESANFNQRVIREGSKKLRLKTDASLRFEHGIDPNLTELAINRAAYFVQKIAKGKVAQGLIDFYPGKVLPKRVKLDLDYVEKLLGLKISAKEIQEILKKLQFRLFGITSRALVVEVPTWRLDISIPEDLIEEIGRIYGYQKIPSVFPVVALVPPKKNLDIFWEDLSKDVLKEAGFSEVNSYSFISEKDKEIFKYDKGNLIEIENPVSSDFQYLRPSLIPNLLRVIQKNQTPFPEIRIFELGKIFQPPKLEKKMLTAAISGEKFFELKGIVELLLNKLGISKIWFDEYQPTPEASKIFIWHPKKSAEIKIDGEEIGFLGEISSRILEDLKIKNKVVIFDIDFEKLSKLASEEQEFRPISKFPAAVRDIAVLVPRLVRVEEVLNKIEVAGGELIRDIDLFDIYEGEELPTGKKNLAFHIIYQAEDRTLSSKEIDELQNKIIKALEENPDWQVRK